MSAKKPSTIQEDGADEDLLPVEYLDPTPEDIPKVDSMDYLELAQDIVKYMLHRNEPPMELHDNYAEVW
jgi:hypothetical protein